MTSLFTFLASKRMDWDIELWRNPSQFEHRQYKDMPDIASRVDKTWVVVAVAVAWETRSTYGDSACRHPIVPLVGAE